jgi:hypothetical protein
MTKNTLILTALQAATVAVAPMTIALPSPRVVRMSWKADPSEAAHTAAAPRESNVFVLIQEGGTSLELYVHAHGSRGEADEDRLSCENDGAYRTSEILEVPESLANLAGFYEFAEQLVCTVAELRSPFAERKDAEVEAPASLAGHPEFHRIVKLLVGVVETIGFPEEA